MVDINQYQHVTQASNLCQFFSKILNFILMKLQLFKVTEAPAPIQSGATNLDLNKSDYSDLNISED